MPKIVLSLEDNLIKEFELENKEMTVGRRSSNDIQIQNLAVSGRHARIMTTGDGIVLEDMNSTNGTYINGRLIKKQALVDGDEVIIGKYKLAFYNSEPVTHPTLASLLHTNTELSSDAESDVANSKYNSAIIEVKNGAKAGQILPIEKPVTTLGRPGIQIAAIMKKPEGYFFMHIESDEDCKPPRHNRSNLGEDPVLLKSGDSLTVADISVQFMLS